MPAKSIFIAATGQNVGKTTVCLGILAGLLKRLSSVGFIKPVGQQHIQIREGLNVDKDVALFKKNFNLSSDYQDMSPVILPAGFTRDYLDHKIDEKAIEQRILQAFEKISSQHAFTLVEGTGHIGVGSIINMCNAKVAALLRTEIVIIASGGLGSAHDELALNIALCQQYQVKVKGVILNRVLDEKRSMIEEYFPKSLKHWNIPLLGCIPFNSFLSAPTLKDYTSLFKVSLIAGEAHKYNHLQHPRLIADSLAAYQNKMVPNELIITPANREDIILATLARHQQAKHQQERDIYGLLLTGDQAPSSFIIDQIKALDAPALYTPIHSYDAMKMITSFTAKIREEDSAKIEQAIHLVENNVNLDLLLS
jgi:phosphate acetyltransferase